MSATRALAWFAERGFRVPEGSTILYDEEQMLLVALLTCPFRAGEVVPGRYRDVVLEEDVTPGQPFARAHAVRSH